MIIEILLIIFVILATLHFFYEGIVAPTSRIKLSYKMKALKRRLWDLRETSLDSTGPAFDLVENGIDWSISNLRSFTITTIYFERRSMSENDLTALINERNKMIESSGELELIQIVNLLDSYLFKVLLINCGGFFFWLSPLILFNYVRNRFVKVWPDRLKSMVRSFVFVPVTMVR